MWDLYSFGHPCKMGFFFPFSFAFSFLFFFSSVQSIYYFSLVWLNAGREGCFFRLGRSPPTHKPLSVTTVFTLCVTSVFFCQVLRCQKGFLRSYKNLQKPVGLFFFYHPSSECRKKNLTIQDPQKKVEKKILCLPNQVWPASLNQETINRCYFLFYFFLWVLCVSICQTHLRPRRVFFFILVKRRFIHSADFRRHEQIFLFTIQ